MKRFLVLLAKELRELITPQTVVPIVLVVIVFMGLGKVISAQAEKAGQPQPVKVIDNDNSAASGQFVKLLEQAKLEVTLEHQTGLPDWSQPVEQKAVVVIPEGFGKELAAGQQPKIASYTIQDGFSVAKLVDSTLVSGALAQANAQLAAGEIQRALPKTNPTAVLAPVQNDEHIVVAGKVANISPAKVVSYLNSQIAFVPVILFIVILFAGQMVATAMANEKENKTLETLLSVPISRTTIVGAKMLAAGIVASVTAAAYVYGLNNIQSSFTGGASADAATKAAIGQLGLNLSVNSYLLLGVSLFLGILTALAIALVLGSFADNIKSVQSLIMPLMVLLLIPYLASMTVDIGTLPPVFKTILYAIPFTYTFQTLPNLYVHNYTLVVLGSAYVLLCFVLFMLLAAKLFSSDRILTMRLDWLIKRK